MKNQLLAAALAGLLASTSPALSAPAQTAQPAATGIAVANIDAIIANSNAYRAAQQQQQTTYKAQLDQVEARRSALQAQLKPLADKFNADRAAVNPNQAALQQELQTIQGIQQSGQQELQTMAQPLALSQAYVTEQIGDKLDQAIRNAMTKSRVSLLIKPEAVVAATSNAYSLDQAIVTELNALIPSAQVVPPPGWQPREIRDQQAQQQQQQQQQPPAATPKTQGR